jgi:hypothetical protein
MSLVAREIVEGLGTRPSSRVFREPLVKKLTGGKTGVLLNAVPLRA